MIYWGHDIGLYSVNCILNNATSLAYAFRECEQLTQVNIIAPKLTNMCGTFEQCQYLINAPEIPNGVTDISGIFSWCYEGIRIAPNIPNTVVNMSGSFAGCSRLIVAPIIPNSVINLVSTFEDCHSLSNAPIIPNSVTNMCRTFSECYNLVNVPEIPDSVTNLSYTFNGCSRLINSSIIGNNVLDMTRCFSYCTNLTGDIVIYSENVNNISDCFYGTSLDKNVYIPYKNNGNYTQTYNTFINAGYSVYKKVNGVLLKYSNSPTIIFDVTPNTSDTNIYLNGYEVENNQEYIAYEDNDYEIYNPNYMLLIGSINNLVDNQQYTLTKDITSMTGYTITLNVDQTGCNVEFDINGIKYPANVNNNLYTLTLNTDHQISIGYSIKKKGYLKVNGIIIFNNSNVTENITMEESSIYEYDYQYPFDDASEITDLVDGSNFIVNESLQAIISGPTSYHNDGGASYGYITFTTEDACELLINGYVSSEGGCDYGGVYVGTEKYYPDNWEIESNQKQNPNDKGWLFAQSGTGNIAMDYTMQLDANTTYVLTFAYAKDGSVNNGQDRLIINRIKFEGIIKEES